MVHRFLIVALLVAVGVPATGAPLAGADDEPERVVTYRVLGRGGPVTDLEEFARHVALTLEHPRGWSLGGSIEFRRVAADDPAADVDVVLAAADAMSSFGRPCGPEWSCRAGRHVAINEDRWVGATPTWPYDLGAYRHYVVNHEMGHWLGLDHRPCRGGPDDAAPVMAQLSKGPGETGEGAAGACRFEIWPTLGELAEAAEAAEVELGPVPADDRSATLGELESAEPLQTAAAARGRRDGRAARRMGGRPRLDQPPHGRGVGRRRPGDVGERHPATPRPGSGPRQRAACRVRRVGRAPRRQRRGIACACMPSAPAPTRPPARWGVAASRRRPSRLRRTRARPEFDAAVRLGAAALGDERPWVLRRWLSSVLT